MRVSSRQRSRADLVRELVADVTTGARTISGTDWPIVDQLHRTGAREWTVTRDLCNGVPRSTETYRSEAAAREAFGSRLDGRKPRTGTAATERVTIRITTAERERYEAAADVEGSPLGEWIRAAADLAIARGSTR